MENPNTLLAIYEIPSAVERAIAEVQVDGLPYRRISVLGQEKHSIDHAAGYCIADGRMRYWGRQNEFWDSLWGVLTGAGLFWAPNIGPVLVAGPLVALTAGALESNAGVSSLGAIGAGLYTLGLSKSGVTACERAIRRGNYVLVFMGSTDETERCRKILANARALETRAAEYRSAVEV